ncbi:MAG: PIN domain-containing protein [Acidobacteriota bacterium]
MIRALLDTNVVLDVLLDRRPHAIASAAVWAAIENRHAEGLLSAHSVTTIYYLYQKERDSAAAKRAVSALLKVFSVAPVTNDVLTEALQLSMPDFEDAVTASAARHSNCTLIVTRDPRGFRASPVRCLPPGAALPLLLP